jgi:protein O-GlcNAc transferase
MQRLLAQAQAFCQQGRLPEAARLYEQVLNTEPRHFDALNMLAAIAAQMGEFDRALQWLDRALAVDAHQPHAHNNRGNLLAQLGQHEAAVASYERAIALWPDFADAHGSRGNALFALNRIDEAVASFDRAIALQPDHPGVYNNRGVALAAKNSPEAALASYGRAIALAPDYAEAHFNRGGMFKTLRRWEQAVACYERVIALMPDSAEAHFHRADALMAMNRVDAAIEGFDRARALDANLPFLCGYWLHGRAHECDWRDEPARLAELASRVRRGEPAAPPFVAAILLDAPDLLKTAIETAAASMWPANPALGPMVPVARRQRIHVAYVSADFREHPAAFNMVGLFEHLDRSRVELTAISLRRDDRSAMQARMRACFERFVDADAMSDLEVARLMRELGVDIAVDMMGPTQLARGGIFALRAAPIQVNHYAWTAGVPNMDYILGDPVSTPMDHATHFTEKIAQLPNSLFATDSSRAIARDAGSREAQGLPKDAVVFCAFNNSYKIRLKVFECWMRILAKVPGSVLWLRALNDKAASNLRREAVERGIDPARLVFASRTEQMADHLARHRLADLFLDTLPFNAQTTASDALWAGLPVLTCLGHTTPGRVAGSLLSALGLPELITRSLEDYEQIAVALGNDPARLQGLREKLASQREVMPLFDTPRYAVDMLRLFEKMHERRLRGEAPDHLA